MDLKLGSFEGNLEGEIDDKSDGIVEGTDDRLLIGGRDGLIEGLKLVLFEERVGGEIDGISEGFIEGNDDG